MEYEPSPEDLEQLRQWIKKTPHVLNDYDDEFLSAFIRACKGSLQKTKTKLENFNGLGMKFFELFGNLDIRDQNTHEHLSATRMFPFPKLTADGSIVFMVASVNGYTPNVTQMHSLTFFRILLMTVFIHLWEKKYGSGKWILIFDCKYSYVSDLSQYSPITVKRFLEAMQTAFPVRLQAMHFYNVPLFMEWVHRFAKSITNKKIADRIDTFSFLAGIILQLISKKTAT